MIPTPMSSGRARQVNIRSAVERLLFPVKPLALFVLAAALFGGCGYHAEYGGQRPTERLSVEAAPAKAPSAQALSALLAGARAELSRAGVLAKGQGYPKLRVELLRVDELASGIGATPAAGTTLPLARGSSVGVVARAWVEQGPGSAPSRDTGDLRRVERYASQSDPRVEAVRNDEAVRAAARRLGTALARQVLGEPEPGVEPM
jgi:hypothetical protein